ncbi:EamA family transporter [Candidatus Nomurabacteria bacterium]|nr:EamA family transporter [Candidatus Nomurabacteria bacterium]
MWLFVSLVGYFLLALVFVLDKKILTSNVQSPVVYTFYSTIFMFAAFLVYPFGVERLLGIDMVIALISGLTFGFAMWTMFIAVQKGEASHIDPFIGGIVTIATFVLSSHFLGESLNELQMLGIGVLLLASFLLSFEKSQKHSGFHTGFAWAVFSGVLFAISHVSAKYVYVMYDFVSGFVWTKGLVGIVGIIALCNPKVWKSFRRSKRGTMKWKKQKDTVVLVTVDKILGVLGVVCIQYASALGNTAPVFALSGIQFVFMFVMIFVVTKVQPRIFREFFTRRELVIQSLAIFLVVVGTALFVL